MITIHKVAVKCPFFLYQSFMTWSLVFEKFNFYCWLDTTSSCMDLFSRTQIKTDGAEREGLSCPDMAGTPRLRLRHGLQTPSYNALEITDRYRKRLFFRLRRKDLFLLVSTPKYILSLIEISRVSTIFYTSHFYNHSNV